MPAHTTHEVVGIATIPLVFFPTTYFTHSLTTAFILSGMYLFATFYLSPDLDIDSAPYFRWGMFRIFWEPYKVFIPHRSFLSHSGIFSGTIRFIYLMLFVYLVTSLLSIALFDYSFYLLLLWISMVLADLLHTFLDFFSKL